MKKFNSLLDKIHTPNWLTFFIAVLIALRIPSFFEAYTYGDEMIYLTLGEGVRQGLTLYKDIHDNKPPLLYLIAALSQNLFWFKALLAGWMVVTVIVFWNLTRFLFPKNQTMQKVATIIFGLLTTIPLLEGNIANAENFMIGFTLIGFLIIFSRKKSLSNVSLFFSGFFFGIAALFKIPAVFDIFAILGFWAIEFLYKKESFSQTLKRFTLIGFGFATPLLVSFLWYFSKGALLDYIKAAYFQNVGYLSSFRPGDVQKPFLEKNAPLLIRASVVLLVFGGLTLFRKKLSKTFVFCGLWLIVGLFAVTLSERPYPHYLLQIAAPVSLLIAILIASPKVEQAYSVVLLFLACFVPVYYKFYYYNSFSYYERFLQLATGAIDRETYLNKFDPNASRNYHISQYLAESSQRGDKVFIWGDSPPIYALSRRLPPIKYVATYHIHDFWEKDALLDALTKNPPTFVILLPEGPEFPELRRFLSKDYVFLNNIDQAQVWKKMAPGLYGLLRY